MHSSWLLSLALLPGFSAGALAQTLSPGQERAIDSIVTAYLTERHAPGVSVAIGLGDAVVYSKGYGLADLEHRVPVTVETRFQGASTLKPITAAAVLTLVESGRIDLDASAERYCPQFPGKRWPVSIRALLSHQAGIRPSNGADVFNRGHFATVTDALRRFVADSLVFEPGERAIYTNEGYVLLERGRIIGADLLNEALKVHQPRDGRGGRGWGWIVGAIDGVPAPRVAGSTWTGSSAVLFVPSWNVSVALSSNLQFEQPAALLEQLARIAR